MSGNHMQFESVSGRSKSLLSAKAAKKPQKRDDNMNAIHASIHADDHTGI